MTRAVRYAEDPGHQSNRDSANGLMPRGTAGGWIPASRRACPDRPVRRWRMAISDEVRAAVGGLALETTWLEYLAARLVAIAGLTDNEMALLAPRAEVFKHAREAAAGCRTSRSATGR